MTAQEAQKIQPGETIYWQEGKKFLKGTFKKFSHDVLDIKSLTVELDNGEEDEILHVMLISSEDYMKGIEKLSKHKFVKNNFVKNKIEKNEEISDEEITEEINENEIEITEKEKNKTGNNISEKSEEDKNIEVPPPVTNLSNTTLTKVSSPRGNNTELKPNLKTLQILLQKQGYHIERDPNKWVRYILTLPNSESIDFSYKGKVWELYNIYIESGIQGLLNLR